MDALRKISGSIPWTTIVQLLLIVVTQAVAANNPEYAPVVVGIGQLLSGAAPSPLLATTPKP